MLLLERYVDDTDIAQTVPRGSVGSVQIVVSAVEVWSQQTRPQLNVDKCKEMVIDFKNSQNFFRAVVSGKELPVCSSVKVLGVTASASLK